MKHLLFALLLVAAALRGQAPPEDLHGRLDVVDGQKTLSLWGSPRERGFAHGWLLAEVIVQGVDADLQSLLQGNVALYEATVMRLVAPKFAFSPDEVEEMKGILAGIEARLPEEKRVIPSLKRALTLEDLRAANTVGDWVALGCSTIAVSGALTGDGHPAAARNFDFAGLRLLLEDQIVVVVKPDEGRFGYAGVTHPGGIGVMTGMNSEGVFASIHDVRIKAMMLLAMRPNVPRLCALRRILTETAAAGAVAAAHEAVRKWPTLYGNNFMIVAPDPTAGAPFAGVLEYDNRVKDSDGVTLRTCHWKDCPAEPFLACSNHHRLRGQAAESPDGLCNRYDRLYRRLTEHGNGKPLTVAQLFETAGLAAVPKADRVQEPYRHGTLHEVVALTGPKELHLKCGVPGKNIRDVASRRLSVPEALAAIPAPAGAAAGNGGR